MRNLKYSIGIFVGFLLAFGFWGCSKPTDNDHAGDGSETTNAMVMGKLYLPNGHVAANATLHLRKKSTLADTSGSGLHKALADTTATVTTTDSGTFAIDSVVPGLYVIEGAKDSDVVLIDSVRVQNPDSTVTLPPDTLKPAGALKGVISLSEGGDPRKVFILAFGIDRFAGVNLNGSFKFSNLAEGRYDLRIISSLDNYGVLDTFGISINSADTANLDTLRLPFTGIPTPKNLGIVYDTLRQMVTLTWAKADINLVGSYNVYRRNVDSNTILTRINASPITDTSYIDHTLSKDATYEYVVTALDKQNNEGNKSFTISVVFQNQFKLATSSAAFGSRKDHSSVVFNGNMWVIAGSNENNQIMNDVWSSVDGITWTKAVDSAAFPKRKYHASVVFNNLMWVIGGYDGSPMNDVWNSTDGINWVLATDSANFPPRYFQGCVVLENKIWVIGGESSSSNYLTDVWNSSDGITWSKVADSAGFSGRTGARYVVFKNQIWMVGGAYQSTQYNDVWSTADGTLWTRVTNSASFPGRYYHSLSTNDSLLWIFGGLGTVGGNFIDGLQDAWFSTDGINWSSYNMPPTYTKKRDHTSLSFQNKIWIIGQAYGENRSDIWYYK